MFKALTQRVIAQTNTINAAKPKIPKRPLKEKIYFWFKTQLKGFCEETPLHGYNHTVSSFLHFAEKYDIYLGDSKTFNFISNSNRIFWRVIIFIASVVALVLLYISWSYNVATPTITVIESTNYPAYNIPFPSVTVCNVNRISMRKALQIAGTMYNYRLYLCEVELVKKYFAILGRNQKIIPMKK
jgi:hypothetical protein